MRVNPLFLTTVSTVSLSESSACHFDKRLALLEMIGVIQDRGRGARIHDLQWKNDIPKALWRHLVEREDEWPELRSSWVRAFEERSPVTIVIERFCFMV